MEVLEGLGPVLAVRSSSQTPFRGSSRGQEGRGVLLEDNELRLDIGTPETYWEVIKSSYEYFRRMIA